MPTPASKDGVNLHTHKKAQTKRRTKLNSSTQSFVTALQERQPIFKPKLREDFEVYSNHLKEAGHSFNRGILLTETAPKKCDGHGSCLLVTPWSSIARYRVEAGFPFPTLSLRRLRSVHLP